MTGYGRFTKSVLLVVVLGLGIARVVGAIDDAQIDIERMEGAGWSAQGIHVDLALPGSTRPSFIILDRVRMGADQEFRAVRIECAALELTAELIGCPRAQVALDFPQVGRQAVRGRIAYQRQTGIVDLDVQSANLLGGRAHVKGTLGSRHWRLTADVAGLDAAAIVHVAKQWQPALPAWKATGRLNAQLEADGGTSLRSLRLVATFEDITASNDSGSVASEKLSFAVHAALEAAAGGWSFAIDTKAARGQAYYDPVFLDFGVNALAFKAQGHFATDRSIAVEEFAFDHVATARARGRARLNLADAQPVRDLELNIERLHFPGVYTSYVQPFLIESDFSALTTAGIVNGSVSVVDGVPQRAQFVLRDVALDDGTKRFALRGVDAQMTWSNAEVDDDESSVRDGGEPSSLSWQGGSLLGLALGPATLRFTTTGRNLRLLDATRIPLFDGSIDFESLRVRNAGLPSVAFMVDATIQPISVVDVCRAFGWPEFGGRVGGSISKLRLRDGVLTLGTTLEAQVFDGRVAISDLRLEDALGRWPRFHSSIALQDLDLELVTRAFSFGRITGRLSGSINDLQLFNWRPVAFDASLFTPADDRSRHLISQRAVENIGSIGGSGTGITQALSSGFLRFFENFRYERLGLSCRLENDVCHMNGVAPAPNGGYYLVKGSGLPRIDVIGGARRVDWPRLVNQLIAITESEGPVVK